MKFRYLIVGGDHLVTGTNDETVAKAAADFETVCDVAHGVVLCSSTSGCDPMPVAEEQHYQPAV